MSILIALDIPLTLLELLSIQFPNVAILSPTKAIGGRAIMYDHVASCPDTCPKNSSLSMMEQCILENKNTIYGFILILNKS